MPVVNIPIGQGFYESESLPISAQQCINFNPSTPETVTITQSNVFGTPGLEEIEDAGDPNTNRGAHVFMEIPYFVNGTTLYRLNRTVSGTGVETFTLVSLGTITGSERVSIADNGSQMCIVIPELTTKFNAFILDSSDVLTQISDVDFDGPASAVVFNAGFFVFTKKDGNKFFKSALRDGFSYNALDFGDAEADPDPIRAPAVYRNQLIIFGSETLQPFQNVGGADFPYVATGGVEQKGIFANNTLLEVEGFLFWIGGTSRERPQILIYDGGRPQTISTRAIEFALKQFTRDEIEDSFSFDYSEDGSSFIGFTLPTITFVYDLSTTVWHQRASEDVDGNLVAYRISNIVEAYGSLIVGDIQNGNIGILSKDTLTEYTNEIRRRVVLPPFDNDGNRVIVNSFELVAETGVGLAPVQQGDDPIVRLSWSDDGGRTFTDTLSRSLGAIGEYTQRVIWRGLGSFDRSRMFALDISDPVKIAFLKTEVDIDG